MHRFLPSSDEVPAPRGVDPAHTAAIERWTREILQLDDAAIVIVTELACADPGCPVLETTVAVLEAERTRKWRFNRPRVAVTKLLVRLALAAPPSA